MCNNHYTDSEGVTWQYRTKGLTVLERSTDGVTWSKVANRIVSPDFGNTTCDVVYQEGQFSWTRDPPEILEEKAWLKAIRLASDILQDNLELPGTEALYFQSGNPTSFFKTRKLLGQYGQHNFYK